MTSKRKSARYFGLYEAKNKKIRKQLALSTPIESVGNKNEVKERDLRPVLTVNLTPNSVGQLEGESSAVVSNSSVIVTQIVGYENNPPPTTPSTFSFKDYISTPIKALTPTTATTTVYNTPNEGMNYPLHRISLGKEGIESPLCQQKPED